MTLTVYLIDSYQIIWRKTGKFTNFYWKTEVLNPIPGGDADFYILFDTVEAHACTLLKLCYF